MSKKNHLMTPEERAQHDFAGKLRRMTDKQLVEYVNARHSVLTPAPPSSRAEAVKEFIDLCAVSGKRMGPATIAGMKAVAREAGIDIGI